MYFSSSNHNNKEEGFTLIELLVVILIIGILSAIAIPAFLNQRKSAAEASVKSDLKNAAVAIETAFVSQKVYPKTLPADVKTSDGVTITLADKGKYLATHVVSSTSSPESSDIVWGVDSTGPFNLRYYKDGKHLPAGAFYYFAEFSCDGVVTHTWKSGIDRIVTTNSSLWDEQNYLENWQCPSTAKDSSVKISPAANGANITDFTPFTMSTSSITGGTGGYCIQASHSGELSNVWKYDSLNGGLQKGVC